jgi:7-cyano-7-deazaguanine synthase in queuosine biosynthesis
MPRAVVVERAIRLGMEFNLTLHTPLMYQTKRETVALAQRL